MQLVIELKDESKLDFLIQFSRETSWAEVLSTNASSASNGFSIAQPRRKKKLTPR